MEELSELLISKVSAKRVEDNQLVYAENVTKKDGPFYCEDTQEELIVRKCIEKVDHFAYKSRISPTAKRESELHKSCKKEILEILQSSFPQGKWEEERSTFNMDVDKGYEKVIPDLSGKINDRGVIIEIQKSTISIKDIQHRSFQYSKRGGYILWIIPLINQLGEDNFRPRLFERFLHTMYFGRVYYWHKGDGTKLTPVHFGTAQRWIEETSWFDESGVEQFSGGYDKPFMRVKKPQYGDMVDLRTDFKFEERNSFELENDKLSAPDGKIFMDNRAVWWNSSKQ